MNIVEQQLRHVFPNASEQKFDLLLKVTTHILLAIVDYLETEATTEEEKQELAEFRSELVFTQYSTETDGL